MSVSVLASIFAGPNETGTGQVYGVPGTQRYHRIPSSELATNGLWRSISSTTEFSSPNAHASLLLFGSPWPFVSFPSMYLKIHQQLHISIDWWPDYEAWIEYHVALYLDGAKRLKGYVARWAYWVEGGVKSSSIASKLEPKVIDGMNTLDAQLSTQLGLLSGFTFKDVYYMPGKHTTAPPTGVVKGTTWDDVTICLEH